MKMKDTNHPILFLALSIIYGKSILHNIVFWNTTCSL